MHSEVISVDYNVLETYINTGLFSFVVVRIQQNSGVVNVIPNKPKILAISSFNATQCIRRLTSDVVAYYYHVVEPFELYGVVPMSSSIGTSLENVFLDLHSFVAMFIETTFKVALVILKMVMSFKEF